MNAASTHAIMKLARRDPNWTKGQYRVRWSAGRIRREVSGFSSLTPLISTSPEGREEIAMFKRNRAFVDPAAACQDSLTGMKELAEGRLRSNPYLALKNVSCDCRDNMLFLQGCLPTYYLKQLAQEVVAGLEGVKGIHNQIQVVSPDSRG
jgi:hypothetical protein